MINIKYLFWAICGLFSFIVVCHSDVIKKWDFKNGIPAQNVIYPYKTKNNNYSCEAGVKQLTPDGNVPLKISIKSAKNTSSISARQLLCFIKSGLIKKDVFYQISFWCKSSRPETVRVVAGMAKAPYALLGKNSRKQINVTEKWQKIILNFKAKKDWNVKTTVPRISFGSYKAGDKLFIGPISVKKRTGFTTVDISKKVNMGFADEIPGDGEGGWSDQGSGNDMRNFDFSQKSFCEIPFSIINPKYNNGKGVLSFRSPKVKTKLRQAEFKLPASTLVRKYLYLLHTTCWGLKQGEIGSIRILTQKGNEQKVSINAGIDIADWWNPRFNLKNAMVAYQSNNNSNVVGIYLSKFALPAEPVKKIILKTSGKCAWIVLGMTLSDENSCPIKEKLSIIKASSKWKPIDLSSLGIKRGSALDLSKLVTRKPAGAFGKVIVNKQGKLAFEKFPNKPVRFFCANLGLSSLEFHKKNHSEIESFAEAIFRQGYNMVRFHFLDTFLMGQGVIPKKRYEKFPRDTTVTFHPGNLEKFDYFVNCLKKRGIYIYLDAMTSWSGYTSAYKWYYHKHPDSFKPNIFVSAKYRANWRAGVKKLLNHVNPYTGTSLKTDPILACLLFFNEQNIQLTPTADKVLNPEWRKFLKKQYPSIKKAPVLSKSYTDSNALLTRAVFSFILEMEEKMTKWYQNTIKAIGYEGLTSQWDFLMRLVDIPARAMVPVISMHTYQSYPSKYIRPGSSIGQNSSFMSGGGSFKWIAPTRFLDRPFVVTEYGHVFWNQYRYEQGLLWGAFAAFQGWDQLSLFANPVMLNSRHEMRPFNNTGLDPINRASEVLTAFAFLRRDVSESKHTIEFPISKAYIENGNENRALNDDLAKLYTLCKVGISYSDKKHGPLRKILADMKITPSGSSKFKGFDWHATIDTGSNAKVDLKNIIAQIRQKKLISKDNLTNLDKGIFQTDTREITMFTKQDSKLTVITPRLEGIAVKNNKQLVLKKLKIRSCSVPASVAVISLNKESDIKSSKRLLIIFSTDALNTNMSFRSSKHNVLVSNGKLPVLMRTGKLALEITNSELKSPEVYALKLDGSRAEKIPSTYDGEKLKLLINTEKLKSGPTPFFEVISNK